MRRLTSILALLTLGAFLLSSQQIIVVKKKAGGGSTPAFVKEVQQWNYTDSSLTETFDVTQSVAAGHLVVIPFSNGTTVTNVVTGVSDTTCGSTWYVYSDTAWGNGVAYTYCTNGMTTSTDITLTWTGTNYNYKWGTVLDFSGSASTSIYDADSHGQGSYSTDVSAPLTTSAASTIIVGIIQYVPERTYTIGGASGFTLASDNEQNLKSSYVYRIVSSAATYNPVGTLDSAYQTLHFIISLKGA